MSPIRVTLSAVMPPWPPIRQAGCWQDCSAKLWFDLSLRKDAGKIQAASPLGIYIPHVRCVLPVRRGELHFPVDP